MNVFLITYDLKLPDGNRRKLEDVISSLGDYTKPLRTTYLVKSPLSLAQVKETCGRCLDKDDRLIIAGDIGSFDAFVPPPHTDWILGAGLI